MRVSGAAKVQWTAPRRKMGEFLESRGQLTGQKTRTRQVLRRVTSIWPFAAPSRSPYTHDSAPSSVSRPNRETAPGSVLVPKGRAALAPR